jgi:peptide deformylase
MIADEVNVQKITSTEIQSIIDRMLQIARGERSDPNATVMVGLAAPQIGIMKRIILVDTGFNTETRELGNLEVFVNPEIIWASNETIPNETQNRDLTTSACHNL